MRLDWPVRSARFPPEVAERLDARRKPNENQSDVLREVVTIGLDHGDEPKDDQDD